MPRSRAAAGRYASALFQLAASGEQGLKAEQALLELKTFERALHSDKGLEQFFLNPTISRADKKAVLADLETKLPSTHRFLSVLVDGGRMEELHAIIAEFEKKTEEASGEIQVQLSVARNPKESQLDEIRQLIETEWKRRVKLNVKVEPELLGGFVARSSGRTLVASAEAQLNFLAESLGLGER